MVAAKWHTDIVQKLVVGAVEKISEVTDTAPDLFWVSGSYEIPQIVQRLASSDRYQAIVPLGCIIRGDTPHFELIAQSVFSALDEIARRTSVAVSNGVLTTENMDQALERAGGDKGNKGVEAAVAALETAQTIFEIGRRT